MSENSSSAKQPASGRLADKVALVVGAGSRGEGMSNGRATAILFAREGAKVVCADLNADSSATTVRMIEAEGGVAVSVAGDVSDPASAANMVEATVREFGRIDILHNNVGIAGAFGSVVDVDIEKFRRDMAVNLEGALFTMRAAIPHMLEQGSGSIVNVSSIAGERYVGVEYVSYYASKAALNHLTRATALDFAARGIRANVLVPGFIWTPIAEQALMHMAGGDVEALKKVRAEQVPMQRMGEPWDIAEAALYLASDASKFVTGTELVVDGGMIQVAARYSKQS